MENENEIAASKAIYKENWSFCHVFESTEE